MERISELAAALVVGVMLGVAFFIVFASVNLEKAYEDGRQDALDEAITFGMTPCEVTVARGSFETLAMAGLASWLVKCAALQEDKTDG